MKSPSTRSFILGSAICIMAFAALNRTALAEGKGSVRRKRSRWEFHAAPPSARGLRRTTTSSVAVDVDGGAMGVRQEGVDVPPTAIEFVPQIRISRRGEGVSAWYLRKEKLVETQERAFAVAEKKASLREGEANHS